MVNLGAYYLIGIPLAVLFAFVFHMGGKVTTFAHQSHMPCFERPFYVTYMIIIQGLWFGIIAALFAQALFLLILTLCTNWENEVRRDPSYSIFFGYIQTI